MDEGAHVPLGASAGTVNATVLAARGAALALVLAAAPHLFTGQPSAPPIPRDWRARVSSYAETLRDAGFSGVILVRVGSDRPAVHALGSADTAASATLDADVAFDIGSITKQFTASAVLRLEAHGLLSVRDSIGTYLPDVPADKQGITIHQLLTHTAGLPEAVGQDYERISRDDYVRRVMSTPLRTAPGAEYRYSNVGYSLLAAIVELRTGESFDRYLQRELFQPAGMRSTGYRVAGLLPGRIAVGFAGDHRWGRPTDRPWERDGPYWNLRGNGGMLSTASDMLRWHDALESRALFSSADLARMYTRHTEEGAGSGTYYGYGWALFPTARGTTLVTHNGGNGVFFADFLRFRDERVVVFVASNRMRREFRDVGHTVARLVFDSTFVPAPPRSATPVLVTTELPDTEVGRLARRLLAAVTRLDSSAQERFVNNDYAASLRNAASMDRHLQVLARLRATLSSSAVIKEVVVGEEEVRVTLSHADGRRVGVLRMGYVHGPGGLGISGIGFED